MFSKKNELPKSAPVRKNAMPSIISQGVEITGNVVCDGEVQLDGTIDGDVRIHRLTLGEQGAIDGSVEASEVIIKGRLNGCIKADSVILEASADVRGDIHHRTLSVQPGARIDGTICQRNEQEEPQGKDAGKVTPVSPAKQQTG